MADIPTGDDDLFDDFDAALAVGRKVIEMADRVKVADKCVPGAVATYAFEMDGQTYRVELSIDRSAG